jgi:rabenosyn-5
LPLPEGAPPNGSQDRLQRALAARGQLFLSEKLGLLRSLGNVEELGGGRGAGKRGKAKPNEGQHEEYTVKSLADLLEKEDVAKVREKVGPELEAAAKLNVLREYVSSSAFAGALFRDLTLSTISPQARSARPVLCRRRERSSAV